MTYRELLELYKKDELDEQKKTELEADIEKQEAIGDYLYEKAEIPELEASFEENNYTLEEENTASKQEREFMKMVNRGIRRAFLKMGTVIGAVILMVVLFVQLVLPHLVSSFYYNPGKEVAESTNQMSLDMAVYSELAIPGYIRDNVSVEDKGYGNYDISIYQNVSRNGSFTNLSGKIDKGQLTLYDINVLKPPTSNVFAWFQMYSDGSDSLTKLESNGQSIHSVAGKASYASENLKRLSDSGYYVAYVTLDKMMRYDNFIKTLNNWGGLNDVWCAVCTQSSDGSDKMLQVDNIGFQCTLSKSTSLNWNRVKYPNLLLWDITSQKDANTDELNKNMLEEDFMKTHFISMLRYMSNQGKFCSMMDENVYKFSKAADYVEKNGLTIYGFATIADKKTLLELDKKDEVYEIYTQPLK